MWIFMLQPSYQNKKKRLRLRHFNGDHQLIRESKIYDFAEPRREKSPVFLFPSIFATMNWVQRKIYLYNVTFGLYMLDWWERFLFNTLVLVLMWFVCYNGTRYATEVWKRYVG